ncbi:MAG: SDR family oxidoreductase [Haloferacaceae archaeon]
MRLEDTTVVVTGASRGLGAAMARAFVAEGARVVCAARTAADLNAVVADAEGPGEAMAVPTDVREWASVAELFEAARDAYGPIDVVVANAGVQQRTAGGDRREPVVDVPVDVWDAVIRTNLSGAFHTAKAALPEMLERDAGRIVFISSGAGTTGRANRSPYIASKHGLEGLASSLAKELDGSGVDSLVFRPPGGGVYTESRSYRERESYAHESPTVVNEPMVQLASGAGDHGGHYVGTADGTGFEDDTQ